MCAVRCPDQKWFCAGFGIPTTMKIENTSDKNPLKTTIYECAWNIRTLNGGIIQFADTLRSAKSDITGLQEMRLPGQGL